MKFLPGPKSGGPLSICRPQLSEQASGAVLSRGRYGQALQGHASWKAPGLAGVEQRGYPHLTGRITHYSAPCCSAGFSAQNAARPHQLVAYCDRK